MGERLDVSVPGAPAAAPATEDTPVETPDQAHRLVREVLIYGAGGIGMQLLLSLAVPFFTRIFTPADYGVIETTATVVLVLAMLASLGLESASQRSYFDYGDDEPAERRAVLSTALWTLLATSAPLALALVLLREPVARALFDDRSFATPLALAALTLPFTILAAFWLEILRVRRQPGRYITVAGLAGAAGVVLALLFSGVFDAGLNGYYAGLLSGTAVAVAAGLALVRNAVGATYDRAKLRVMLAYGLPLVPVAASTWLLQFVDRFFLLRFSTLEQLGLYGVGARLSNLLLLVVTAFALAWSPFMLELHQRDAEAERRARGRVLTLFTIVLCFAGLALTVYAYEALRILTPPEYHDAYVVVGLLSGSVVALGINSVTMSEISLKRRTLFFTRYAIYVAALNMGLNFLLIPPFETIGAAAATALSYGALAVLYYWRAQRLEAAPFEPHLVLRTVAVTTVLAAVGTFVTLEDLWLSVLVKLPLLAAFFVLLRVVGVLERGWLSGTLAWIRGFFAHGVRVSA